MNQPVRVLYNGAAQSAAIVGALVPSSASSKLARTFTARRGVVTRFEHWAAVHRDASRQLLWIHAASVGEGLMALPVIQHMRRACPTTQIVYTLFSPSAEQFAREIGADFTDYLPFDTIRSADRLLAALTPTALVFSKLDIWPLLVERAAARGVPIGIISASMPAQSQRHGLGTILTQDAYRALTLVGAASPEDAHRLIAAGARAERTRVTGDTRYDQAWSRAHEAPRHREIIDTLRSERPTLVAGSTWSADEGCLLPAWEGVMAYMQTAPASVAASQHGSAHDVRPRLVIAPHEIRDTHLRAIETWAAGAGLQHVRLGDSRDAPTYAAADVIIVDRLGILADLYALATVAYVGGGFHAAGLHSVVEPAVFHVPTLIGPRHEASRDAVLMGQSGGVACVADIADMTSTLCTLFTDRTRRQRMADALHRGVLMELGAADRSVEIVRALLDPTRLASWNDRINTASTTAHEQRQQ